MKPNLSEIKVGEALVELGCIDAKQLESVLAEQKKTGQKLGEMLVTQGLITEEILFAVLAKQFKIQYVALSEYGEIPKEVLDLIPEKFLRSCSVIPINFDQNKKVLTVAMSDPTNIVTEDDLRLLTKCDIKIVVSRKNEIIETIEKYYGKKESLEDIEKKVEEDFESADVQVVEEKEEEIDLGREAESAPIVKVVNYTVEHAIELKASDILIEPQEKDIRVRYRIDGTLYDQKSLPEKLKGAVVARIKIMAKMDITERRRPQDGRIKASYTGKQVNLRISTIPTAFGEKVAIRIIDSQALCLPLSELGFEEEQLASFENAIKQPYGMILITGPTGSGKTTTLYSALNVLNLPDVNIMTVEEPVEVMIYGTNQVNVNEKVGLTFASALRAFLRQDPNIIMVGEIRDKETVEIAINAALTGHLVFATLHTNDASSTITRLINMNIEPFLIASTLTLIISQKLVRKICKHCREAYTVPLEQLLPLGVTPQMVNNASELVIYKGKGCDNCNKGYRGRIGIYEVLDVTDPIREMILKKASHFDIKQVARQNGMLTLRESALRKLFSGVTTIEEVVKNTFADEIQE